MVLGLSLSTYTLIHVLISLAGIGSGFVVMYGLLTGKRLDGWTAIFLTTTVLTSLTGFLFPFEDLRPSYIVGAISLVVLVIAIFARYSRRMVGTWRWIYIVTAALALYLNCFVAVAQSFLKIPPLHAMAPTGSEPPFLVAQLVVLALFVVLTILAARRFRTGPPLARSFSASGR